VGKNNDISMINANARTLRLCTLSVLPARTSH
jgi:hypothetical protein